MNAVPILRTRWMEELVSLDMMQTFNLESWRWEEGEGRRFLCLYYRFPVCYAYEIKNAHRVPLKMLTLLMWLYSLSRDSYPTFGSCRRAGLFHSHVSFLGNQNCRSAQVRSEVRKAVALGRFDYHFSKNLRSALKNGQTNEQATQSTEQTHFQPQCSLLLKNPVSFALYKLLESRVGAPSEV